MIGRALVGLVNSKTALTDLIGHKFWGGKLLQGYEAPKGYYRNVSKVYDYSFDGQTDLKTGSTDIFLYASEQTELQDLMATFELQLNEQSGTYNGVDIYYTRIRNSGADGWSEEQNAYVGRIEIQIIIRT